MKKPLSLLGNRGFRFHRTGDLMKDGAVSLSFTKLIQGVPESVIQPTAYFLLCYNYIGLFS